ncbi:MAG: glycosyl transferase family 2 [Bryobacterales bacterium]|nr:glycosyl transferase family 2 [Bryobacterales bacterium]
MQLEPMVAEPVASVLMSNYNYARYIGEAIQSVLDQTYGVFELLICDDGSTDNSCEVIESYANRDSRVRLFRKGNGGQASGYNIAFENSRGQIICLSDSDDIWLPTKLEAVIRAFRRNPCAGMVAHPLWRVTEHRRRRGVSPLLAKIPSGWQGDNVLLTGGILDDLPPGGGLCVRREVATRIFPFPEKGPLGRCGDLPFMRLGPLLTSIAVVNEPLIEWRQHGKNGFNSSQVTASDIERDLDRYEHEWRLQFDFLEGLEAGLCAGLRPLDVSPHVVTMKYLLARLRHDDASAKHHHERMRTGSAVPVRSLFWRLSIYLPGPVFHFCVRLFIRQNVIKAFIARLRTLILVRSPARV